MITGINHMYDKKGKPLTFKDTNEFHCYMGEISKGRKVDEKLLKFGKDLYESKMKAWEEYESQKSEIWNGYLQALSYVLEMFCKKFNIDIEDLKEKEDE